MVDLRLPYQRRTFRRHESACAGTLSIAPFNSCRCLRPQAECFLQHHDGTSRSARLFMVNHIAFMIMDYEVVTRWHRASRGVLSRRTAQDKARVIPLGEMGHPCRCVGNADEQHQVNVRALHAILNIYFATLHCPGSRDVALRFSTLSSHLLVALSCVVNSSAFSVLDYTRICGKK